LDSRETAIQTGTGSRALPALQPQQPGCGTLLVSAGRTKEGRFACPVVGREAAWEFTGTLHSCCNPARFVPKQHLLHNQEEN